MRTTSLDGPAWPERIRSLVRSHVAPSILVDRSMVGAILALFFVLGAWYSLVVPPFETPDEIYHYAFTRHLALGHGLPVQTAEHLGPWEHEGTQPPLYYFLVGRLTAGIDHTDFDALNRLNPHANLGDPLFPGNKNRMLYSTRPLSLQGTNLALHIGRWFSLLLGAFTLLFIYATAQLAMPGSRRWPLLTLLTVALIPQFGFISATVSNDNMVNLLGAATVYWLVRLVVREAGTPVRWWEWGVLGVLLGLAALSKLQGLGLFFLSAAALLGLAWLNRDWRLPLRAFLPVMAPALAIAGWWYWRNYALYGEWLGIHQLLTINGLREIPQTWDLLWGELRGVRYSFWGLFGWFSILLPTGVYQALDVVTLLALVGFALTLGAAWQTPWLRMLRQPALRVYLLLSLWAAMLCGLMLYWLTFATSGQGRLLFPGISAFGILLVVGLRFWLDLLPNGWRLPLFGLLPAGLLACSIYALTELLPASYHAPGPIQSIPAQAVPIELIFDGQIELVAADVPRGRFRPGDQVPVTLYLRTLHRLPDDYELFVQLLGQENLVLGNVTTHPGWGRNPTSLWHPGAIYPDHYLIEVRDNISNNSPVLTQIYVGFIDPETELPLPVQLVDGTPIFRAYIDTVEVVSAQPLDPEVLYLRPVRALFADVIDLKGYDFPTVVTGSQGNLPVTLLWEAAAAPPHPDYTAFVHLIDAGGEQVSGFDQPPAEGRFPTSYWRPGDRSLSRFILNLSPDLSSGRYDLWVGLYSDTQGVERAPVTAADHPVQDRRVYLGAVELR